MIDQTEVKKTGSKMWLIYGLIVAAIFGAALALRAAPMYEAVFGGSLINLQGVDGVYHLRLVENLLQHFPFRIAFDPYTFFPFGEDVYFAPLYDLITGLAAWIVGFGSPDQRTIETVAAWVPAVLGALTTIPVYFIGKTILNRVAGIAGALLVGFFPGTLLFRSRLGFFDHHIAEIFFSTLVIMCLVLALKSFRDHPITFEDIRSRAWKRLTWPLVWSALTGVALGLYLLAWVGGLLFVFLVFVWLVVMFIIDFLRKQPTDYLCIFGVPVFLFSLLIVAPMLGQIAYSELYVASLLIGLAASVVLSFFARFMNTRSFSRWYFPLAIAGCAGLVIIILFVFFPTIAHAIVLKFRVFSPNESGLTVAEMRPMFIVDGKFTLAAFWNEFNFSVISAALAFVLICISYFRKFENWNIFIIIWSLLILIATAGQIRFTAYITVVMAVLAGYFFGALSTWIWQFFTRVKSAPAPVAQTHVKRSRRKHSKKADSPQAEAGPAGSNLWVRRLVAAAFCVLLVFFAGLFPNFKPALANASTNAGIMDEWRTSLLWMRENTPEPFADPDFYYASYERPEDGKYDYPDTAYGVLAWWDYGHMITQLAHRIPNANPFQAGAVSAARYFITQNEKDANKQLDTLGTKYVMIDFDIAVPYAVGNNMISGKKFYAMPTWVGEDPGRYFEIYYQIKENRLYPLPLYYPDYYNCMVARLYNFHGQAVEPVDSTSVVSYTVQSGNKIIDEIKTFDTYESALAFLDENPDGNYRIVGTNPFISPVPLEQLTHYRQVYLSPSGVPYNDERTGSAYIEIFEYVK